ncbi:putative ammonium transporter 3 [Anneissia japonica]|uniref:putative ammonium transporter 3 n=1 Tax=Anneissia japonica TaxID=1529436 RepID=UPI00142576DE|nr:putative ammonium transporter 3 [Anneissia japonica]
MENSLNESAEITKVNSTPVPTVYGFPMSTWDDATWTLTSAFIIFTMQSGFGLLESGSVSQKNEVNIMVKNAVDVLFGGISYWMFGYGLCFGVNKGSNAFVGVGYFFVDADMDDETIGHLFAHFFFQASFATTATTIVSGSLAERTKLEAYIVFSFLNTLVYCFPARWVWAKTGWLHTKGAVDIAGAGAVHLVGGVTGLVSTIMLKPRLGRFDDESDVKNMGSPTNALLGMFMLWWGWLGFNCGSTYGITDYRWKFAARSAVATITSSVAGGTTGICLSYITKRRTFDVSYIINGVLGALVAVTAFCALCRPYEGIIIGSIGALIACSGSVLMEKLKVDDPVGVFPVHGMSAIWSMLAVGLFGRVDNESKLIRHNGLFNGGGFELLGIQALGCVSICCWSAGCSYILLLFLDITIGLRMSKHEEILGADLTEHGIRGSYDRRTGILRDEQGNLVCVVNKFGDETYFKELKEIVKELHGGGTLYSDEGQRGFLDRRRSIFGFSRSFRRPRLSSLQSLQSSYRRSRRSGLINADITNQRDIIFENVHQTASDSQEIFSIDATLRANNERIVEQQDVEENELHRIDSFGRSNGSNDSGVVI